MQKIHERVPMDKKIEGFKSLFFLNKSRELETEPLLLLDLVIQGKDVVCLIYNTTCNFNLGVIRIYMFEI